MFAEFLIQNEFYKQYMENFSIRSTIAMLEMEHPEKNISSYAVDIYNNKVAFMSLIDQKIKKLSPYDVIVVADRINNGVYSGYRKTQVDVKKAKNFFPINAKEIPSKMYSLFDSYYNIWCDLPVYEKEARLHIELVRIQPFEDGNKRTSRIITNYNLCKLNKAPIVISGDEVEEYFNYIDNYDVEGLSKFFEKKSREEFEIMLDLFTRICGHDIIDVAKKSEDNEKRNIVNVIDETDNDVKLYSYIRDRKKKEIYD